MDDRIFCKAVKGEAPDETMHALWYLCRLRP